MDNKTNKRKYLWVYAGVLFLSALAVLLLTAFSQMKLTGNIEEYNKKLKSHENKIKDFNISLNSATVERDALKKRIKELETENESYKSASVGTKNPYGLSNSQSIKEAYENLLKADSLFKSDKKTESAQTLKNIKEEYLGEEAAKKLKRLKDATYLTATKVLYSEGKTEYSNKNYSKAETVLKDSLYFDNTAYFEENTLFYLVMAERKQQKTQEADKYLNMLTSKYPNSSYLGKIKSMK
ncbi:MAG: tetratricopeptide repeat protein [Deltaproteobacteria bacterium]